MVGGPGPQRTRPSLQSLTAAGAAAVLLLGIGAVAGRFGRHDGVVRVTRVVSAPVRGAPTPTPRPSATGPSDDAPLSSLIVPAPTGFLRTTDTALPVATLAKQFAVPSQTQGELTSDGYTEGLRIVYNTAAPVHLFDIELWRFASDTDAADFADSYRLSNQPGAGVSAVAPATGTPGGFLYTLAKPDPDGYGVVLGVVVRGRIIVRMRYDQPDDAHGTTALTPELARQYARLPAGGTSA